MQKIRNRSVKARTRRAKPASLTRPSSTKPHDTATPGPRVDAPLMLRPGGGPPRFPDDLIIPAHRGAVITSAGWPQPGPSAAEPAALDNSPIGRKARRNAARMAAAMSRTTTLHEAQPRVPAVPPAPQAPDVIPAALADSDMPMRPLPRSQALVARRQGFVDVLALVLRDSGRRLARWSSARRRADDMKQKLSQSEARLRVMEAQLSALQALQARVPQS